MFSFCASFFFFVMPIYRIVTFLCVTGTVFSSSFGANTFLFGQLFFFMPIYRSTSVLFVSDTVFPVFELIP